MIPMTLTARLVLSALMLAAFFVGGPETGAALIQAGLPRSTLLFGAGLLLLVGPRPGLR